MCKSDLSISLNFADACSRAYALYDHAFANLPFNCKNWTARKFPAIIITMVLNLVTLLVSFLDYLYFFLC